MAHTPKRVVPVTVDVKTNPDGSVGTVKVNVLLPVFFTTNVTLNAAALDEPKFTAVDWPLASAPEL